MVVGTLVTGMPSGNLADLLASRGIDSGTRRVYLMRHADQRYPDMFRYIGTHALTLYQAVQKTPHEVNGVIVAFYGNRAGHGLLLGAWRIDQSMPTSDATRSGLLDGGFEDVDTLGPYFHVLTE